MVDPIELKFGGNIPCDKRWRSAKFHFDRLNKFWENGKNVKKIKFQMLMSQKCVIWFCTKTIGIYSGYRSTSTQNFKSISVAVWA